MSVLIEYAALSCVLAGLLTGGLVLLTVRDGRLALMVALDFWIAAGLLRLSLRPGWDQLISAAAIIAVRQIVGLALWSRRSPRRPPTPDT
ncbi:DUF1622 domain-containing protein [Micromonospora sp. GCM10011542]|uniref:DUF1622 domain-containing protein n=1 Tax=Micromonospora sp. GCM10011542 TaxID=3317337 RepID=UPI00360CFD95